MIPAAARDRHIAILGSTGSGKTTAAKSGIVEPILDAGGRAVVIDPAGGWWGLRLNHDGKRRGYGVYIFGGEHGDCPLRAKDAEVLAEVFGRSSDSAIFDTSSMTVSERTAWFTEFAEAIRRKNRGPLHVVIDEAHLFMPQAGAKVGGLVPAMLHAGNNLVSLGRSKGLRITMITQRPAKLHKDSLSQAQALVAMRVLAPQDRKAIAEWIAEQADPEKGKDIIASLPSLRAGEAWVWAPLQDMLERVKFRLPKTFDSSRAPDELHGEGPELAPINLDALKERLASLEAEVKANDPKVLKAEIAALKRQMATTVKEQIVPNPEAERRGYAQGWDARIKEIADASKRVGEFETKFAKLIEQMQEQSVELTKISIALSERATARSDGPKGVKLAARPTKPKHMRPPQPYVVDTGPDRTGPQRKIISSLSFWHSIDHDAPSRDQVALVAGYSPRGSAFTNPLGALKSAGVIAYPEPGRVCLIDGAAATDLDRNEAKAIILGVLSGPQRRIIDAARVEHQATREEVARRADYSPGGSAFTNPLGALRTLGLIYYPYPGVVALTDWARELLV